MTQPATTGPRRRRTMRPGVRFAEGAARVLISIGGVGTILAVAGILLFLVWVVLPLFGGARVESAPETMSRDSSRKPVLHAAVDEQQLLGWSLHEDGSLLAWRLDSGAQVERRKVFVSGSLTASAFSIQGDDVALGFGNGKLLLGRIAFRSEVLESSSGADVEGDRERAAGAGEEGSIFEHGRDGQLRKVGLDLDLGEPIDAGIDGAIRRVDLSEMGANRFVCALGEDGRLVLLRSSRSENLLTGEVTRDTTRWELPFVLAKERRLPDHLLLAGGGDLLYLAWEDGRLVRHDLRDPERASAVEEVDLVEGDGELTALAFLIGKTTLISGDSRGRVNAWFPTKPADARTSDGIELALAHRICDGGPAITALGPSARSRVVAVGDASGGVRLWHVTSGRQLASMDPSPARPEPVTAVAFAPKEDGVVALGPASLRRWRIELRHPEAGLAALFAPVWYECHEAPEHVWQSSSGTDDFEPKLGLVPLVFGTLKATLYTMLFAVPLALLAAVYTSQFLSPALRTPVKSTVEMMASLPSVVLGFLAAMVVAPFAEAIVPAILAGLFLVPFALLLGARLWQLLPAPISGRLAGAPRLAAMSAAAAAGVGAALLLGPALERTLFAGDLRRWLDRGAGSSIGGWVILLLPVSAVAIALALARAVDPRIRRASAWWSRGRCARVDLLRFLAAAASTIAVAFAAAWVLEGLWLDPRGGVFDTYVQRNALVVGFVMGFAVVPIIYTLAEDALSSVPAHLRLASLGAGATPWQTAVRIVVPTAASGLFSAVMVGLGRAVGETMIVLMATGNTPVLSWNVFDGFRTLSANIAVELPEAVKNSTHYRTLFLAGLCLFALTFALNTLAEIVRQRFRRRAYEL